MDIYLLPKMAIVYFCLVQERVIQLLKIMLDMEDYIGLLHLTIVFQKKCLHMPCNLVLQKIINTQI